MYLFIDSVTGQTGQATGDTSSGQERKAMPPQRRTARRQPQGAHTNQAKDRNNVLNPETRFLGGDLTTRWRPIYILRGWGAAKLWRVR